MSSKLHKHLGLWSADQLIALYRPTRARINTETRRAMSLGYALLAKKFLSMFWLENDDLESRGICGIRIRIAYLKSIHFGNKQISLP